MKKKIVLIGPTFPYRGGNALFMNYLHRSLSENYEVLFINFSLLYPKFLFPGQTQYDKSETHFDQLPSLRLINSINPISWLKTSSVINKFEPDLILFDWWQPFFGPCYYFISLFISDKSKIAFIAENLISHESRFIDKVLTRIGLNFTNRFLVLSNKVNDDIRAMFQNSKIIQSELPIYNWYEKTNLESIKLFKLETGIDDGDRVLLFFGYIRKYKGLDLLLESLKILVKKNHHYKLIIAGEFYDDPQPIQNYIKDNNLSTNCIIWDQYIPNEKVSLFFDLCDVVVLPYRSATQSGILNMAYGHHKPVIATNVGGLAEFIERDKTGLIVDSPDPKLIAKEIEKFYELKGEVEFEMNIKRRIEKNSFQGIREVIATFLS